MDETTQQNAALVEETTSAAQSMKEQAVGLMRQVNDFKLAGAGGNQAGSMPARQETRAVASPAAKTVGNGKRAGAAVRPKAATSHAHEAEKDLVGVAGANGQDRRRKDEEFEEF
jgi:methyl-accepting chemotaxis protein